MKKNYELTPSQKADAARLKELWDARAQKISQMKFALDNDLGTQGNVGHLLHGRSPLNVVTATKFAKGLGVKIEDFSPTLAEQIKQASNVIEPNARLAGLGVAVADEDSADEWFEIPYYYAKGSCGNGSENYTDDVKGYLRKEKNWLDKYKVKQENLFAVYGEGYSNADFIMPDDIVIFDKSKRTPKDDTMFFIKHPGGDRIKTFKRKANGNWLLTCRNHDKSTYPDEEITEEEAEQITILGEFVYRQG